jgi:hypothetical protein
MDELIYTTHVANATANAMDDGGTSALTQVGSTTRMDSLTTAIPVPSIKN